MRGEAEAAQALRDAIAEVARAAVACRHAGLSGQVVESSLHEAVHLLNHALAAVEGRL